MTSNDHFRVDPSCSFRPWLASTEPVLQRDKVRRLALGVLILIASSQNSQRDNLGCRTWAVSQTNVQTNTCDRREPANAGSLYLAVNPWPLILAVVMSGVVDSGK